MIMKTNKPISILNHKKYLDGSNALQEILDKFFVSLTNIKILEAGCGSNSRINIPEQAHVTGIDISQEEMDKNPDINEKIVGDIQTYDLPNGKFDLVVCSDVLEHLPNPNDAMVNMLRSMTSGGLLLLALPNVFSVKGLVAKFTPLWVHSMFNKFTYGKRAGSPGLINFPTFLRWEIAPQRIIEFAQKNDLSTELAYLYESGVQRRFRKKVFLGKNLTFFIETLVSFFSFRRFSFQKTDCLFLFKKKTSKDSP